MSEQTQAFKAVVAGAASKEMSKSNGATYVVHAVEITEPGKLFGIQVPAARTLVNGEGEEKSHVGTGQEVIVYMTVIETPKGREPRFEISERSQTATPAEVLALLQFDQESQAI